MTTTRRSPVRVLLSVAALAAPLLAQAPPARALQVDERGEMRLGLRAYTDVRLGTEKEGGSNDPLSYPSSGVGHVRQNRFFLELKFDHDLKRLAHEGFGLSRLFGWIDPNVLKYSVQYRGEGEGIYDYGPNEWSDQARRLRQFRLDSPNIPSVGLSNRLPEAFIQRRIEALRRNARQRHRFFLGYLDFEKGPLFVRVGRQVLAWGETDVFRLLDYINPLDNGFGGFFIALDERRVPLDMVRGSYHFTSIGPLTDAFLEGFVANGNKVSTVPGIPPGSPWEPGGLGTPNPALRVLVDTPARDDLRGGARFVFNYGNVTYSIAHYYTYTDVPGIVFRVPGPKPPKFPLPTPGFGHEIIAKEKFPRVPVTGGSLTFPVPSWYSVVRAEAAYLQGEPFNRQGRGNNVDSAMSPATAAGRAAIERLRLENNTEGGLDPFVYPRFADLTRRGAIQATLLTSDTFNMAIGLDVNRFIRQLNPGATFFMTTQFFYKHVMDSPGDLVLPVAFRNLPLSPDFPVAGTACGKGGAKLQGRPCRLEPRLFHLDDDQFLQTLAIFTTYSAGRIMPIYAMFYDWQGALVFQPGVVLTRDPFRVSFDYTRIEAAPTGQIGTLRDRDNVRFQVEYVF